MRTPRPTDEFGPIRSRLLGSVTRLRSRPWLVFLGSFALIFVFTLPVRLFGEPETVLSVTTAITSLLVVGAAIVGGPKVGLALSLTGGIVYNGLAAADTGTASLVTGGAVLGVWIVAGIVGGMMGDRYRGQVQRAFHQMHSASDALDRVLEATPSFHLRGSSAAVARAVCDAARQSFGCDLAALFSIETDRLRLLARSPFLANTGERLVLEPSLELQDELRDNLLPCFVADIRKADSPRLPRAITGDPAQVAAIRAPVLLDDVPVALLAMSWAHAVPVPQRAELGVVQRFVEHAAVALGQAQRAEAQREVGALYHRFQASLVPTVDVSVPGISAAPLYRPGERRMLLGGDFVDTVLRPDHTLAAVIGDVTGHGPDAAALGSSLRAAWRALMLRGAPLGESLRTLNSLTLDESARAEAGDLGLSLLATVCVVIIDGPGRTAQFAVAGHPAPLLLGDEVAALRHSPGPMLGIDPLNAWPVTEIDLAARWGLLLYTDGIIEARVSPTADTRLGIDGLAGIVARKWDGTMPTKAALDTMVDAVQNAQGGPLPDDVTLLFLAEDPESSPA